MLPSLNIFPDWWLLMKISGETHCGTTTIHWAGCYEDYNTMLPMVSTKHEAKISPVHCMGE